MRWTDVMDDVADDDRVGPRAAAREVLRDRDAGQPYRQLAHQGRVAGAAAGRYHLADSETPQVGCNHLGAQRRKGCEQVVGRDFAVTDPLEYVR